MVSAATAEEQQARLGGQLADVAVPGDDGTPADVDGNLTVEEFIARVALAQPFLHVPAR